ncbi:MAG: phosphoglycerate dehydrogenase [Planctomycetes bacterium]|nr:phosphoglycerate dehydrogenase [Planctomycetota bacterium]
MAPANRNPRVLVCDELASEANEIFRRHGCELETRLGLDEAALIHAVVGFDAVVVRSATRITKAVIAAADRLRVIGRAGVGVDNIDCDAATARGVVVMNTPDGNTLSAAELALAHLFALARNLPRADRAARSGWKKKGLMGTELTGKTLGVIGLGRIGGAVAERAIGLKLRVLAYDPFLAQATESPVRGVELATLEQLLAASDFVTLHVPLNEHTRHLLSRERLAALKPGARVINAARGGLIDEAALIEALDRGHVRGAALDVLEEEPPSATNPMLARDDVILSPHLGASSDEAQRNVAIDIAEQIVGFLVDGVAKNAVNAPTADAATLRRLAPYLKLAERAASFLAQRLDEPLARLELELGGEFATFDPSHARLAVQVGALRPSLGDAVNFVSAPRLARERGLELLHAPERGAERPALALVAVGRSGRRHRVAGDVFAGTPKFTELDALRIDLEPEGALLVTRHADLPGVVGTVGTLFGRHAVNIRRIELGPIGDGEALGLWSLYAVPSDAAVAELAALPALRSVALVRF